MKTRTKLGIFMICFAAIPIIFLNILISNKFSEVQKNQHQNSISKIAKAQSDNISIAFEELLNQAKEIVSTDYIRDYTVYSNSSTKNLNQNNSEYAQYNENKNSTQMEIEIINKLNTDIETTLILNTKGTVIASSDELLVGQELENFDYLTGIADESGGISKIFMQKISGVNIPVFYIARNIYSADNIKQGVFLQLCNTNNIQRIINNSNLYKSSNTIIIDSYGNVLTNPFTEIASYNDMSDYSRIKDYLKNSISTNNEVSKSKFISFSDNGKKAEGYNVKISNSNWALITVAEEKDISKSMDSSLTSVGLISFYISIILIASILVFVYFVTKPIDNIVDILVKKQRGDQTARFKIVNANDEFGKIGKAFNLMLDDVFESEQRYRTIVEMTDNIVFEINFKKNNVFISNNFNQKFSFRPKSDNLQDSFFYKGRIHKDDKERFMQDFERILDDSNYLQGEYRFKNIYGDFGWILIRATKFFDRDESPTKVIGVIVDIDREKKSEMHLLQKASFDALTQLYNRDTFIKTLANEFELCGMRKTLDAVLFIDLDDFKHFNDEYGHACGDEVLKYTADSLKEIVFDKGFAGRFGGDEFVVCLTNQKYFGDSGKVAQDIIDALSKGFISESVDKKLVVNCSIGIAFFDENGKNCEEVLNAADEAMYGIKKHGKSNFGYASKSMLTQVEAAQSVQSKND